MSLVVHGLLWGLLFLPLALGLTWWSYRTASPAPRGAARVGLPLLRAAAFALVLLLLLEPVLVHRFTRRFPPVLAVLLDNSASIPFLEGRTTHGEWAKPLEQALSGVELEFYSFGDTLLALDRAALDSLPADRVETDLDGALRILERETAGRHLAGVLLVSDGNSTRGGAPLERVKGLDARLWTAVTGRTEAPRDLQLASIELNREVRRGLAQPIRLELEAQGLEGRRARLTLSVDGRPVSQQTVVPGPDGSRTILDLSWTPDRPGARLVEASISLEPGQGGEATLANNSRSVLVTVRERGRRITVLTAQPSPDLALVRRSLEGQEDLDLRVGFPDLRLPGAPSMDSLLAGCELLVLVDWPRPGSSPGLGEQVRRLRERIPALWIDRGGTAVEALGAGWPLQPGSAQATGQAPAQAQVLAVHPVLGSADRLESLQEEWRQLPPVSPVRRSVKAAPGARVLLSLAGQPLLGLGDQAGRRSAVLAAAEIWRWEIGSQLSLGPNTRARELVVSLVRWLGTEGAGRLLQVESQDEFVSAGAPLRFQARLQREDGLPRDGAQVELDLVEADGSPRRLVLESRGNGLYTGSTWGAGEGLLHWTARAREGDRPVVSDSGLVNIERWNGELRALKRNQPLMIQLAQAGEGHCFDLDDPEQRAALARGEHFQTLERRTLERAETNRLGLREQVWLLLLALALLSAEWVWRRLQGLL